MNIEFAKIPVGENAAGAVYQIGKRSGKTTKIFALSSWDEERMQQFLKQFPGDFVASEESVRKIEAEIKNGPDAPEAFCAVFVFVNELHTISFGNAGFRAFRGGHPLDAKEGEILHAGDAFLITGANSFPALSEMEIQVDLCKAESAAEWLELLSLREMVRTNDPQQAKSAAAALLFQQQAG